MRTKGTSLVELVLYSVAAAVVILGALAIMDRVNKGQNVVMARTELETEVDSLTQNLIQTGRLADSCAINDLGNELNCFVNYNNPPTAGPSTAVKFTLENNSVVQKKAALTDLTAWTQVAAYRGVVDFILCDDQRMEGYPVPCPIVPLKMSQLHASNLDRNLDPANFGPLMEVTQYLHFFRFYIRGQIGTGGVWNPKLPDLDHFVTSQGAFFLRNYPTLTTRPNVVYQWGNRD